MSFLYTFYVFYLKNLGGAHARLHVLRNAPKNLGDTSGNNPENMLFYVLFMLICPYAVHHVLICSI